MGRQAMGTKRDNGIGGSEESGPFPKAKRRSLKFASHAIKKEVKPPRCMVVSLSGSHRKRHVTMDNATNLVVPLGMKLPMV